MNFCTFTWSCSVVSWPILASPLLQPISRILHHCVFTTQNYMDRKALRQEEIALRTNSLSQVARSTQHPPTPSKGLQ